MVEYIDPVLTAGRLRQNQKQVRVVVVGYPAAENLIISELDVCLPVLRGDRFVLAAVSR